MDDPFTESKIVEKYYLQKQRNEIPVIPLNIPTAENKAVQEMNDEYQYLFNLQVMLDPEQVILQ